VHTGVDIAGKDNQAIIEGFALFVPTATYGDISYAATWIHPISATMAHRISITGM